MKVYIKISIILKKSHLNFFLLKLIIKILFRYTSPADIYQTDPKRSYNLRSGAKEVAQIPKKKVATPAKQWLDPSLENKHNHRINKAKATELEEINKSNQGFNFENELSKVNVPVRLTKMMKIPSFRDPSYKMLKSQAN